MGVAFVMYSDVTEARDLQKLVEAEGYRVLLHYLHQSESEVEESVKEFPPKEWKARLEHALMLKKLYEQELILEAHPILLVHGIQSAIDWVQRCILSRPRY